MLKPLLAGVFLSVAAFSATTVAVHARELSGPQISSLVAGATVEIDTPSGTKVPIRYTQEGRVSGDARELAWYLGAPRDTGRWWVADGQLCHKWLRWFGGEPQCMKISREGHAFRWLAKDGSSGTASIAVPPSVQAAASALPNFGSAFTKRTAEPPAAAAMPPPPRLGLPPRRDADDAGAAADTAPAALDTAAKSAPVDAATADSAPPASAAIAQPSVPIAEVPQAAQRSVVAAIVPPQPKLVDRSSLPKSPPLAPAASPPTLTTAPPPAAVAPPKHAEPKAQPQHPVFKVANVRQDDVLNVRSGPSADHDIVGMIAPGSRGIALTSACQSQWCPVRIDGTAGWVNSAFLSPEVVAAALSARTETPPAALRDSPEAPRACLTPAARSLLARIEQNFGPVQVISTCRAGAIIAGTSHPSRHASGNAIDFKAGPRKAAIVAWLIEHHRTGGLMTYPGMDHIHIDIGPRFISLAGGRHWSSWKRARSE